MGEGSGRGAFPDGSGVSAETLGIWREAMNVIAADPDTWERFKRECRARAARGGAITRDYAVNRLRGRVGCDGQDFEVNNNHVPVYLRELCRQCPEVRWRVHLRKSRFDPLYRDVCGYLYEPGEIYEPEVTGDGE